MNEFQRESLKNERKGLVQLIRNHRERIKVINERLAEMKKMSKSEIEELKKQTFDPYVTDFKLCHYCENQAFLTCPTCGIHYCFGHVATKPNKNLSYCRQCGYRLHPIDRRFIGAIQPVKKCVATPQGMIVKKIAPKLYPRSDRKLLKNRKLEIARKTGSFCPKCGSEEIRSYNKAEWQCKACKHRFRKR